MMHTSFTKATKFWSLYSKRVTSFLQFCIQAKRRSTFQRRLYARSVLPSCVFGLTLPLLCGAMRLMRFFKSSRSSGSESYARSAVRRDGFFRVNRRASVASTRVTSPGEALSTWMATGRELSSAIAMIFEPFPRFVGPTARPPFLPLRRWRRGSNS